MTNSTKHINIQLKESNCKISMIPLPEWMRNLRRYIEWYSDEFYD